MPDEYLPAPTQIVLEGRPWWRFVDGTLLPVVAGAADGDGGDGGDGGGGGSGDGDGGGGEGDPPDLGEAGKKALAAERDARSKAEKARKAAEKKAADLEARLGKIESESKTETEKTLEKARTEAAEAATKEATAKANSRIVRAEVKAAAGGKLADPNDAVRLLDLDEFEVDEDGDVDAQAIAKAIDQLVKDKPYLAAGGKKPAGKADGGARPGSTEAEVSPGLGRLRAAYAANAK